LNTLSRHHRQAGHLDAALTAARESLHVRRAAAEDRPDAFLAELDSTLSHLAEILVALGDFTGARETYREVASVRRQLDPSNPRERQQDYVRTLLKLAELSRAADAHEEAMEIADEAVTLTRRLVVEGGRDHLPLLGVAFLTQAVALGDASRRAVAIRVNNKAAQIFRSLYRNMPDAVEALLDALNNQVSFLVLERKLKEAERVAAEAVTLLAPLELPEKLAAAHLRHARTLLLLDRLPEFDTARSAALKVYQRLDSESPGDYAQQIAEAQSLGPDPHLNRLRASPSTGPGPAPAAPGADPGAVR
jgi:hypothetical protein